jgi:5-methylcytosine-specific restriction protein B
MVKELTSIEEALAAYDKEIERKNVETAESKRQQVIRLFPLEDWPTLPLERFALGQEDSRETFCWWMEFGAIEIGSIKGGTATKLIIYKHKDKPGWFFYPQYNNEQEAWQDVRAAFVRAFEKAKAGEWDRIDEIEPLRWGPALKGKAIHTYFPNETLPVFSWMHLKHFLRRLGRPEANDNSYDVIRVNRILLKALREIPQLDGWTTAEMMRFIYHWDDPTEAKRVVKIAPGHDAQYWAECLAGGYICVGWDEVGDLREFESKDSYRSRFEQEYGERYKNNRSKISQKANEVWTLIELEPGDLIVANQGTSKVLAVGEVAEPGYEWKPERARYKHTVKVNWDTSYEKQIPPKQSWAMTTVANVPAALFQTIMTKKDGQPTHGPGPKPLSIPVPVDPLYLELANALERKGQVILYGPPGTGKTYTARRFAIWWLQREAGDADAARLFGDAEQFERAERELSTVQIAQRVWWMVANPKEWSWDRLFETGRIEYRYGRLQRNYPLVQPGDLVIGYQSTPTKRIVALARVSKGFGVRDGNEPTIELVPVTKIKEGLTFDELLNDKILSASEPVRHSNQGTLFALTQDEASHALALLAERDPVAQIPLESGASGISPLTRLTFHPSYSYEDFIEGFRPVDTGSGTLTLRLEDGIFKRLCREAQANPRQKYLLIIDEINRANISKVFGEIITLLEKDKRGMLITLPQSKESFAVPSNVYMLGTMNTADRSIKLLDAALRRRFAFRELMPDIDLLRDITIGTLPLGAFLEELNRRIAKTEGREKQIGHSFFMEGTEAVGDEEEFACRFRQEILPLLQEYCYDDYAALATYLGNKLVDKEANVLNYELLSDPGGLLAALEDEFIQRGGTG